MLQKDIWKNHTDSISVDDINNALLNPVEFQIEFSHFLSELAKKEDSKKVIEIGCEQGIITMLLEDGLERHLLDFNEDITLKLEKFKEKYGHDLNIHCQDMFKMNFQDGKFDLVYNAGVAEHYSYDERVTLLKEYSRVLKKDGMMVIAIPNHYSVPYRLAYIFHNYILFGRFWPWPKEKKIYDMKEEINESGLQFVTRTVLAKKTAFKFWRPFTFLKTMFEYFDSKFNYEGYLTVIVIRK